MHSTRYKNGFTLVEVLFAVVIVGIAIASLVGANISLTKANSVGVELSTAEFLIQQIRERTVLIAYDELYAFDGADFSPPININGENLNDLAAFSQRVTVENISGTNFNQVVADNTSNFVRITVKAFLNSREISSASWIRAEY